MICSDKSQLLVERLLRRSDGKQLMGHIGQKLNLIACKISLSRCVGGLFPCDDMEIRML